MDRSYKINLGIVSEDYASLMSTVPCLNAAIDTGVCVFPIERCADNAGLSDSVQPDAILIDATIHDVNVEAIMAQFCHLPVLLMQRSDVTADLSKWFSLGLADYIAHPENLDADQFTPLLKKNIARFAAWNEQKVVSTELRNQHKNKSLNQLLQDCPVMLAVWTLSDNQKIHFREVIQNIDNLSISTDELISGQFDWADAIHEEDWTESHYQLHTAIENNQDRYEISYRLCLQDQSFIWLTDYGRIFRTADGHVSHFQSFLIDATQQKMSEQRYQGLFLQAEKQTVELGLIDRIQSVISDKTNLDDLYDSVVSAVSSELGYEYVMVATLRDDRLWTGAASGYDANKIPESVSLNEGILGKSARTKKSYFISDSSAESEYLKFNSDVCSLISVPICKGEEVDAVLLVESSSNSLTEEDHRLLRLVSENIEIAVENAWLHYKTHLNLGRAQALYEVSQAIQDAEDESTMVDKIINIARKALDCRWAVMYKFDYDNRTIEHFSQAVFEKEPLRKLDFDQLLVGLSGTAIEKKQVVMSSDRNQTKRDAESFNAKKEITDQLGSAIIAPLLEGGKPFGTIAVLNHENDRTFHNLDRELVSTIANQSSLALAQHALLRKINHQAHHDALTGLPNRILLDQRLREALASIEDNKHIAVIFIDLDGFKHVNDTLGHHVGDELLIYVSRRLLNNIRTGDTLARLGGDEFAIILNALDDSSDALKVSEVLLAQLQPGFKIDDQMIHIGASIGLSLSPSDTTDTVALLSYADSAMYQAKADGKNNVRSFVPALAKQALNRRELEAYLRDAVENEAFRLEYHPQISAVSGRLFGVGVCLHCQHPELGKMNRDKLLSLAEDSRLILPMGSWVIRKACEQIKVWQDAGYSEFKLAIKISAMQFMSSDFISTIESTLQQFKSAGHWLEIEITESTLVKDVGYSIELLDKLNALGISVVIDDFGGEESSMKYLHQLLASGVKINRAFIDFEDSETKRLALLESLISLASRFGLITKIEGVESLQQFNRIERAGYDCAQGLYFSQALTSIEFENKYLGANDWNKVA